MKMIISLTKAGAHYIFACSFAEKQDDREDLSHPIHVDNCLLISELNECIKEPPAYTHRDYRYVRSKPAQHTAMIQSLLGFFTSMLCFPFSAILYLNDDFEGGEFIFTELDAKTVTVRFSQI